MRTSPSCPLSSLWGTFLHCASLSPACLAPPGFMEPGRLPPCNLSLQIVLAIPRGEACTRPVQGDYSAPSLHIPSVLFLWPNSPGAPRIPSWEILATWPCLHLHPHPARLLCKDSFSFGRGGWGGSMFSLLGKETSLALFWLGLAFV